MCVCLCVCERALTTLRSVLREGVAQSASPARTKLLYRGGIYGQLIHLQDCYCARAASTTASKYHTIPPEPVQPETAALPVHIKQSNLQTVRVCSASFSRLFGADDVTQPCRVLASQNRSDLVDSVRAVRS